MLGLGNGWWWHTVVVVCVVVGLLFLCHGLRNRSVKLFVVRSSQVSPKIKVSF